MMGRMGQGMPPIFCPILTTKQGEKMVNNYSQVMCLFSQVMCLFSQVMCLVRRLCVF